MPNLMATPTNFPRRINTYVPAMAYSADVNYNGETRVNFGAPLAASATSILNAVSVASGTQIDLSGIAALPETYGRNLVLVLGAAGVSGTVVYGWDYLGQPMCEFFSMNGTTPIVGSKCFKSFSYVTYSVAGSTMSIGTGVKLGLPYKAVRCVYEIANGVVAAAGTLVGPSLVDPQTNATTDPRGSYTTTTTMNGANIISAAFNMVNDVNTSNSGGLHGIRQAAA